MIKHLRAVSAGMARGEVAEIYAQIRRDFGRVVEPFMLHSPIPTLLAGAWMACRETELVGKVPRGVKEAIAATVSMINRCRYCVDAHTIMLTSAGDHGAAKALANADYGHIRDERTRLIVRWVLAAGTDGLSDLPPFMWEEVPEIVGTVVFYSYIDRLATVFLGETPLPSARSWLRSPLRRVAGLMFRGAVRRSKTVGESLHFLPSAVESEEPGWAKANPVVAQAFARFAEAVEEAGEASLPSEVLEFVCCHVDRWDGKLGGISKSWVKAETSHFNEASNAASNLALLAAMAPHFVGEEDIIRFRKHFPGDNRLLGSLSWASFIAARRIGTLIQPKCH
jgi:AhpD family alkylhydroperoxidase